MVTQTNGASTWTAERNARLYGALSGHRLSGDGSTYDSGMRGFCGAVHWSTVPNLTTGDGMLWVLERMRERGWLFTVEAVWNGGYSADFRSSKFFTGHTYAANLPLAVCLAAEKALA
jgi:hypothetical protein